MKISEFYLSSLLLIFGCFCFLQVPTEAIEVPTPETNQIAQNEAASSSVQVPVQNSGILDDPALILEDTPSEQSGLILEGPGVQDDLTVGSPSETNPDFSREIVQPQPSPLQPVPSEEVIVYTPLEESSEVIIYTPVEEPETDLVAAVPPALTSSTSSTTTRSSAKKIKELSEVSFFCGQDGSTPATIAKAKDDHQIFVILWKSDVFKRAGYDPETRCKQVSARFEEYNNGKFFTYLAAGKLNGQSVICLTSKPEGSCGDDSVPLHQGLLFTLNPRQNPNQTLEELVATIESKAEKKTLEQ